jgi:hypothetical protein
MSQEKNQGEVCKKWDRNSAAIVLRYISKLLTFDPIS